MTGAAAETLSGLALERERRFRRVVAVSAAVHAAALVALVVAPRPASRPALPGVVRVDLVAAVPGGAAAPPRSAPAPEPAPEPAPTAPAPVAPPKPPVPEKVVIPETPRATPEPKPAKPEPKPAPPPRAKPKPAPAAASKPADPGRDQGYDDVLAELRAEAAQRGGPPAAALPGPPGAGGGAVVVTPEVLAWMRRAKIHVTRAWVLAPGFRTQSLETEVVVRVGGDGQVLDTRVARRSGNPWFDESVERAVRKASPLPTPPEAAEWSFVFRPQDVL